MRPFKRLPLTELAEIHDYLREPVNATDRNKREGPYPYYGATGQVGWIDDYRQDGNYVLLGEDGAPFLDPSKPKAYLVSGKCWVNNHVHVLRGKDGISDDEYLCYALNWVDYSGAVTGSTRLKLPQSTMHLLQIPAPPIEEQRRIAGRLKGQLTEVETARTEASAQLGEAKKLVTKLREKIVFLLQQVQRQPLGDLLLGIEAGKSFQTSERLANEHELGVLKVSAVSWSEFNPNEAKAIDGDYQPDGRQRVRKGDILISRANTVELVGAVVQVDEDYPSRLLSDKTLRLLPNVSRISADFLVHMLKLPEARSHIESNATGTSDSMRNISQKTIFNIPIPVPEAAIRQIVARELSEIEHQSRKIENTLRTILSDIGCLPGKLLAQAFEQ